MSRRRVLNLGITAAAIAIGALLWLATREPAPTANLADSQIPAADAVVETTSVAVAAPPPPKPTDLLIYRKPDPEKLAPLFEKEDRFIAARVEEIRRNDLATKRFSDEVDAGNYDSVDLNRSVTSFFNRLELEPVLDEDGMIVSLTLNSADIGHEVMASGFEIGDQITHINGVRLHDPADLPELLVRMERDFELCADRDDQQICRRITLE